MIRRLDALARAADLRWAVFCSHCDTSGSIYVVTLTRPGGGITPLTAQDLEAVIGKALAWLRRRRRARFGDIAPTCRGVQRLLPPRRHISWHIRFLRGVKKHNKLSLRFGQWWWTLDGIRQLIPTFDLVPSEWRVAWRRRKGTT